MNYLEMCNEVLVRMREVEISSVKDDNDPQQKLVCKFVNDAKQFVERSHDWNALRTFWVVDLAHDVHKYELVGATEQSKIYNVQYVSGCPMREANARWLESRPQTKGNPHCYSLGSVKDNAVVLRVWPYPDNTFGDAHDIYEFGTAILDGKYRVTPALYGQGIYTDSHYNQPEGLVDGDFNPTYAASPDKTLMVHGFAQTMRLKEDADKFVIPEDPILYYALAYAARERGEAGGASSMELFALAKQYLSDAISWDVGNSHLEYIWKVG
jgi:hypothetical protein